MGLNEGLPAGATPLDGEELEGLLPTHLVNRSQLNEWEQQNIEAALLLRFTNAIPEAPLLAIALSYRLVVTLADLLAAGLVQLDRWMDQRAQA